MDYNTPAAIQLNRHDNLVAGGEPLVLRVGPVVTWRSDVTRESIP